MKIVLIDKSNRGPTSRLVEAAVERQRRNGGTDLELQVIAPALAERALAAADAEAAVVLVAVPEPDLSTSSPAAGRRACDSLAIAQKLTTVSTLRVWLVRHSDRHAFTGVDLVAALLCRVAGVIDDRFLLHDGVLSALLRHSPEDTRLRSMLVIGRSTTGVRELKSMLDEWEVRLRGDGTADVGCWRTAMVLAQLDQLLPLPGPNRFAFTRLAEMLNALGAELSFHLSDSDLRKALSSLADLWIGEFEEQAERAHLPRHARHHQFPRRQPVVLGIPDEELPRRLYEISKAVKIQDQPALDDDLAPVILRVPIRQLNNRRRTR